MKTLTFITILLLAGCASPVQRAQQSCAALGLAGDKDCLLEETQSHRSVQAARGAALMRSSAMGRTFRVQVR